MSTDLVPAQTNGKAMAPVEPGPPPEKAQGPQYVTGFEGMATGPFPQKIVDILNAPFDPAMVEIKPDGICYLPGVFYRERLLDAFGSGGWALVPRAPARIMGPIIVYHGALFCHGRFVAEAFGKNPYYATNKAQDYTDAAEGAKTDCITRCCKDLGIAKELWQPAWREKWTAEWAMKAWVDGGGDEKGKWYYWRKDREVPYQIKGARQQPARNPPKTISGGGTAKPRQEAAGTIDPKASSADSAESNQTSPVPATTDPTLAAAVETVKRVFPGATVIDDGQAPSEEDLKDLDRAVKATWKPQHARNVWGKYFGVQPEAFTRLQCTDAIRIVDAFRIGGGPKYAEVIAELQSYGRIRNVAVETKK
jgi:hypothetical protein